MRAKPRVRVHLADPHPEVSLPSAEGVLLSKRGDEFVIALPSLLLAPGAAPGELKDAKQLRIPRERIAFYEVLG